jgi:transketolase
VERSDGPTALVLTRQTTQAQIRNAESFAAIERGGYVLVNERSTLELLLIATGSEVELAVAVAATLSAEGVGVRVVSMPCVDLFDRQDSNYRASVLPADCAARVAIEAAHPDYWYRFVGLAGAVVGVADFGVSAPGATALEVMGISEKHLLQTAREVLLNSQPVCCK